MYQVSLSGQSGNSMVSIGTNISSDNLSVTNASVTNMTVGNLKTTIFSPVVFNTSSLNASALTLSGTMLLLNVSKLNVCNLSCLHISATSITASNVQPTLTAGTNVTIVNNVISASNDALIPSALNVSSITVTGSTIIGGETIISDSLLVTDTLQAGDFVCNGTITGTNLSTTALVFGNALAYASSSKTLSVETTGLVTQNSTTPITSGAVYSAINSSSSQLHNVAHFRGVTGTSEDSVTPVDYQIAPDVTGDVFFLNYYPKFENSYITIQMCFAYTFGVAGADSLFGRIVVGIQDNTSNVTIQDLRQRWNGTAGGGTRSGDIGMLQGTYKNTTSAGQFDRIKLEIFNQSTNDTFNLLYPEFISVMVTETLNLNGPAATNVYIGSGNISCNAISCLALSVNPGVSTTIGYTEFGNASLAFDTACMSLKGNATETGYAFAQFTNHTTTMNSMPSSYLSFRHANVEQMVMRNSNFGINTSEPTQRLTVVGNASIRGDIKCFGNIEATATLSGLTVDVANITCQNASFSNHVYMASNLSVVGNTQVGDLTILGNVSGYIVTAGQNITVSPNNVISAFVEGTAELNISSLHVDYNTNVAGVLNVSKTSTFKKSLNVNEILFCGEPGVLRGNIVLYSVDIGNQGIITTEPDTLIIAGTGTIQAVDTYLGVDKVFSITTTEVNISNNVNISGTLTADTLSFGGLGDITATSVNASVGNFSVLIFDNLPGLNSSSANFSVLNSSVGNFSVLNFDLLPSINSSTGNFSLLSADQLFTSNMTVSAPDNEPTSFVIHNVSADKTNYALFQNADGQTDINSSNHLYFRTRGELKMKLDNAGQLGIGTLTPDALLHVVGDAHITDSLRTPLVNVSVLNASSIDVDLIVTGNLVVNDIDAVTAEVDVLTALDINTTNLNASQSNTSNLSSSNLSGTYGTIVNLSSTNFSTARGTINNLSSTNISTTRATMTNLSSTNFSATRGTITNLSSTNFSTTRATITNLSGTNASFTTLTASNIQPLLTAGNNIQLVGPILSTTPNVNVSNLSCINLSATQGAFTVLRELDPNLGLEIFSYQITTEELYVTDTFTENVTATDKIIIQTTLPTLYFRDIDHIAGAIQQNNDIMEFRATSNVGGPLVLTRTMFQINCSTDDALFYGNVSVTETLQSVGLISTNASITNFSGVNASFTTLTADNLQGTLIAGQGISIVDGTISTQQFLVGGNNIQIIDQTLSTTPSINVSNLSCINLSATNLNVTGDSFVGPELHIGLNDDSTTPKTIYFGGLNGDNAYQLAVVESRIYGGSENSELLLFKGNDANQDRIRLKASIISFDTYNGATTDRTTENIRMTISAAGRVGIGTTNPTRPLQVVGDIYCTGNISCDGYMKADDKPRMRIVRDNFTLPSGTTSLLNGGSVGLQQNCTVTAGIFIATIAGIYACSCKLRLPDSNNQSPEIQWYRRAGSGQQSSYENFEMWIPAGTAGRRAGMSHTIIDLNVGDGVLPRNDLQTMGGCFATFDVFMIQ